MNPTEKSCYRACRSCWRCADKGRWLDRGCSTCPGRYDPQDRFQSDPDDTCRCSEGVLNYLTKSEPRRHLVRRFESNPFQSNVKTDAETEDERDWNAFVNEKREQLQDATWDPVRFIGGKSTTDWTRDWKGSR